MKIGLGFIGGLITGYYLAYQFIWETTLDFVKDNLR